MKQLCLIVGYYLKGENELVDVNVMDVRLMRSIVWPLFQLSGTIRCSCYCEGRREKKRKREKVEK